MKSSHKIIKLKQVGRTLILMETKRTALPDSHVARGFGVLNQASAKRGKGAILCLADRLSAIDSDNLVVPIRLI